MSNLWQNNISEQGGLQGNIHDDDTLTFPGDIHKSLYRVMIWLIGTKTIKDLGHF